MSGESAKTPKRLFDFAQNAPWLDEFCSSIWPSPAQNMMTDGMRFLDSGWRTTAEACGSSVAMGERLRK